MSDALKIGLVLPKVPGYSETFFRNKIAILHSLGHRVYLFADNPSHIRMDGATVVEPFQFGKKMGLKGIAHLTMSVFTCLCVVPRRSWRFIKLERSQGKSFFEALTNLVFNSHLLLHHLDWLHFGYATMAIGRENIAKVIGAKSAVSFRGYDISIYPIKNPGCYNRLWPTLTKVHTISDDLLAIAYKLGMPKQLSVHKITPAIDVELFSNPMRQGQLDSCLKILTVGRLHWKKGIDYALLALSELKSRGIAFEYTIVGEGGDDERLRFAAWQLGIFDEVRFLGKKPHRDIAQIMQSHQIYLQPSVQEGFCNAVVEAQCSGMICIVSDAEGLAENVLHGRTGMVTPKRSPKAIAEAILQVANMTDDERKQLIDNAQHRVAQLFTLAHQRIEFEHFYD